MKKRWLVPMAMVMAAVAMVGFGREREQPVTVRTAVLQPTTVEETVSCNGTVEAGEVVYVSLPLEYMVEEMLVEAGQAVSAGDALFRVNKAATKALQQTGSRTDMALALSAVPAVVTSPTDGVVLVAEPTTGTVMQRDVPCVTIATRQGVQVRVAIREKHLSQLAVGQRVRVTGAGLAAAEYRGTLEEISATASVNAVSGERTVQGVVVLDAGEADASMRLGVSAKAAVVVDTAEQVLLIAHEAVEQSPSGGRYVYLLRDGRAVQMPIAVTKELPSGVVVSSEGMVGERVILQPERVTDGVAVQEADE